MSPQSYTLFLLVFGIITALIFIFLLFPTIFLIISIIRGAPFVPSKNSAISTMLKFAEPKPGEKMVDIGAGDGRILIAFAEKGVEAHGFEINPYLVWLGRRKIKKAGLKSKAFLHWRNFWKEDISSFNIIVVYGISYIMKGIEKKLQKELKSGSRVIANAFPFPSWPHLKKEEGIYLYRV